jgi:hypothetical protein
MQSLGLSFPIDLDFLAKSETLQVSRHDIAQPLHHLLVFAFKRERKGLRSRIKHAVCTIHVNDAMRCVELNLEPMAPVFAELLEIAAGVLRLYKSVERGHTGSLGLRIPPHLRNGQAETE